jgi:hypothetical protein
MSTPKLYEQITDRQYISDNMSDAILFIPYMDDLFDLPLLLATFFAFFFAQTIHSYFAIKHREELVLTQREEYFCQLTKELNKMDEEVDQKSNKLKEKYDNLVAELEKYGLKEDISLENLPDEEKLKKTKAKLEDDYRQLEDCESEIRRISSAIKLDDDVQLDKLKQCIKLLEDENKRLENQIRDQPTTQSTCAIENQDPQIMKFLEEHHYTTDTLNMVYEVLLEFQAKNRDQELEDYLVSLKQTKSNYDAKLTELDVKRKKMELRLEQTRNLYREELSSFNETKIEYLFKIAGAQEKLTQLEEKNNIAESIVKYRKEQAEIKKNDTSKTSDDF